jgi:hypothetical protein
LPHYFLFQRKQNSLFLERHPEKTALRNQLLTYLIGGSNLTREELNDLLQAVLYKPYYENLKLKSMEISEGFIAVAARETEERVRKEERNATEKKLQAERQLTKRSLMMRLWHKKVATEVIADATELPLADVEKLVKGFEAAQTYLLSADKKVSNKKVIELTGLTADEAAVLIKVLKPSQTT